MPRESSWPPRRRAEARGREPAAGLRAGSVSVRRPAAPLPPSQRGPGEDPAEALAARVLQAASVAGPALRLDDEDPGGFPRPAHLPEKSLSLAGGTPGPRIQETLLPREPPEEQEGDPDLPVDQEPLRISPAHVHGTPRAGAAFRPAGAA